MQIYSLIDQSSKLYRIIRKSPQPSDRLLSEQLREKKYIGSKERKFISESIFSTLRIENLVVSSLQTAGEQSAYQIDLTTDQFAKEFLILSASCAISDSLAIDSGFLPAEVYQKISKAPYSFPEILANALSQRFDMSQDNASLFLSSIVEAAKKAIADVDELFSSNASMSDIYKALESVYSLPDIISIPWYESIYHNRRLPGLLKLAKASCLPGKPCLRINKPGFDIDEIIDNLNNIDIPAERGKLSPMAIILNRRARINDLDIFQSGAIEIQDEGSQMIGYALAPEPDSSVLDACAGAGGKSLQIAALMGDKGTIIGSDTEYARLKELKKRALKSGFRSIDIRIVNQKKPDRKDLFDYVLVDAPCSGIGTLRRDPMKKYRAKAKLLDRLAAKQLEILSDYANFVKPGGILLYATCSIMPVENDLVVEKFLALDPRFEPDNVFDALEGYGISVDGVSQSDYKISLDPGTHATDGFFMARMRRIE